MKTLALAVTVSLALASTTPVAAATIWTETLDAGLLPATAQDTLGIGPLTGIRGNLTSPTGATSLFDIDLFRIFIFNPAGFSASTIDGPANVGNPQLFLFTNTGAGVFMNDDAGAGGSQSALPALPGGFLSGFYLLGIGFWDNEALDGIGNYIFDPFAALTAVVPTAAGAGPLAAWDSNVIGRDDLPAHYEIALDGANPSIPEPGTLLLLGTGVAGVLARRRLRRDRSPCA